MENRSWHNNVIVEISAAPAFEVFRVIVLYTEPESFKTTLICKNVRILFTFLEKSKSGKYYLQEVKLAFPLYVLIVWCIKVLLFFLKIMVAFLPIIVMDTKIIFGYNFGAPLSR